MPGKEHVDRSAVGDAVLDIGGDVGALILYTGPAYLGLEIEVSPEDDDSHRVHTMIRERTVQGRLVHAGIFVELRSGRYRIWGDDPTLPDRVTIAGGEVAEVDWRPPDGLD